MSSKYDLDDFEKIVNKELSVKDVAIKYGVSESRIRHALNDKGMYINRRIVVISPYKTIVCQDKQKCADELKVSRQTISNALKGKRIPMFEELGIKIRYEDERWKFYKAL